MKVGHRRGYFPADVELLSLAWRLPTIQSTGEAVLIAGQGLFSRIIRRNLRSFAASRSGDGGSIAIEYGLIAAFLVVIIIVALVQLRNDLINLPLPTLNAAFEEALS